MKQKKEYKRQKERYLYELKVHDNERLLDFLLRRLNTLSRNSIKAFLAHNQVLVNSILVRQFDFELVPNDIVHILEKGTRDKKEKQKELEIIYEDDEFLVINKPQGLLSIATDNERNKTAYRMTMDYVRQNSMKNRIFICHRLDKETSGILMFCKNEKIRDALQKDWNSLVKKRIYKAIVEGTPNPPNGKRVSYLLETKTNIMYSAHEKGNGQKAITNYKTLKSNGEYSLLELNLETGRKNQIRVHMKDIGHQVVGDDKYHSHKNPLNRLGLHSECLEFIHPFTKKRYCFKCKCPKEFLNLFKV